MSNDQKEFLKLLHLPARLNTEQAAWYLGFNDHDIPVLVRAGLLEPLVSAQQVTKYYATTALAQLREDSKWLKRASAAVSRHWQIKNQRSTSSRYGGSLRTSNCSGLLAAA